MMAEPDSLNFAYWNAVTTPQFNMNPPMSWSNVQDTQRSQERTQVNPNPEGASNVPPKEVPQSGQEASKSSTVDDELRPLISSNIPSVDDEQFLTSPQLYGHYARKLARSTMMFPLLVFVLLGSFLFLGMGLGYANKCNSSFPFPVVCQGIGGSGIVFALAGILMVARPCRIRNRVWEWFTLAFLLVLAVLLILALASLKHAKFVPTLTPDKDGYCDQTFVEFLSVGTSMGIVIIGIATVTYLPLLPCCCC